MKPENKTRWIAFGIVLVIIATIGALVVYLPLLAAVLFVSLTILLAVVRGMAAGFWKGLKYFIREILFGW